jgi:hypothetical protein
LGINTVVRANLVVRGEVATGADAGEQVGFRFAALTVSTGF